MFKKLLTIIFVGVSLFAPSGGNRSHKNIKEMSDKTSLHVPTPSISYIEPK
jgi:hypothetical protein